jgi:hypothetical protein
MYIKINVIKTIEISIYKQKLAKILLSFIENIKISFVFYFSKKFEQNEKINK